ncbi:hypothetical protein [Nonomuraea fuscirosea]|uniref:hypothetical protein n=1 Tax=Nonomuraea fuscirosea TaxID=1291556 RepID=UPI003CCBBE47
MPKFRPRVFTDAHLTRLEEIMRAVRADFETGLAEFADSVGSAPTSVLRQYIEQRNRPV